jgi:integrase
MRKLTKRVVDNAAPNGVRYEIWDSELPGFGLRVEASGTKTFIVRYRANGGGRKAPRRFMTIGRMGVLAPEEARASARRVLGQVATGGDPAGARAAERREMTVADLLELYADRGCVIQRGKRQGQPMKPLTKRYTLSRLNHHVAPLLGKKRLRDVRPSDIVRLAVDITAGKTATSRTLDGGRASVRGGEGAARKVVRDLSAVFTFAQRNEIMTTNPCQHAAVNKTDNQRKRYLTLEELGRLGAALDELEKQGVNPKALNIARLWVLTGFRRNEAASLKRSEVDFDRACAVLGDTKTGASVRPLSGPALALLRSIPLERGSDYFFPADRGGGFYQGAKRIWPRMIQLAGLPGVTPHTLRHTLGSMAVSSGETLAMTGAILGHANLRSTQVYSHLQIDPSVRVANRVGSLIAAAFRGDTARRVVPMRRQTRGL